MKIIILGAGQVGGTLARNLVREDNDITLIDLDSKRLRDLQGRIDIRTVQGHAGHPNILREAGSEDADMIIAVTDSDETNMISCQVAYTLFQTPMKVARIRAANYLAHKPLFDHHHIPIDVCISPEELVTRYVQRLIQFPGTLQVLDFADGKVRLIAVSAQVGGVLVGKTIADFYEHFPKIACQVTAIYRQNRSLAVNQNTLIQANDEIFIIAEPQHIRDILAALGRMAEPYKRIIIGGGGHIGHRLAEILEYKYNVKIIEHNTMRARELSRMLDKTTVLEGDVTDRELLVNENIESTDVFCAVTNDDEANIMSCLLAKRLGARQVMALITQTAYVDLVQGSLIDIAISPQQSTISGILTHIRRGDIVNVYSLRRGAAEAIEIIAHGDQKTSKVVGRRVAELPLLSETVVAAIVRDDNVMIHPQDVIIEPDDHVIIFAKERKAITHVEKLFQVAVGFI